MADVKGVVMDEKHGRRFGCWSKPAFDHPDDDVAEITVRCPLVDLGVFVDTILELAEKRGLSKPWTEV